MEHSHSPQSRPQGSIRSGPPPVPDAPRAIEEEPLELEPVEAEGDGLEPLSLIDSPGDAPATSKIKAFGVVGSQRTNHQWKRHTKANGLGAIRVRSFHGKLSEQGLDFMDNQINDWLDAHPDIEVKHVTTSIGQFEGKIREPALVLNVWY